MKIPRAYSIYLLFITTLFFPAKYIDIHTTLVSLSLIFVIMSYGYLIPKRNSIILFITFFLLVVISSSIGTFLYDTSPLKNITEIVRFFPILLIIGSFNGSIPVIKYLTNVFLFYSISVLTVSFLQIISPELVAPVTSFYNSPKHIDISLASSSRALGLSTGPGQNGFIMAVLFSFAISQIIAGDKRIRLKIIAIASFISVILSQSQTSFILVLISFIYGILFSIFYLKREQGRIGIRYLIVFTPLAFFGVLHFKDKLNYLFSLFAYGLERSSYKSRVSNATEIYSLMLDNPVSILFGHGKGFFGDRAGHMDNEYIFYISIYGLLASMLVLSFYAYIILIPYLKDKSYIRKNPYLLPLHLIVIVGAVAAWPASFILDTRVLVIIAILYIMYVKTNISYPSKSL